MLYVVCLHAYMLVWFVVCLCACMFVYLCVLLCACMLVCSVVCLYACVRVTFFPTIADGQRPDIHLLPARLLRYKSEMCVIQLL